MSKKKELNQEQLGKVTGGAGNTNKRRYCPTCQKEVEVGLGDDGNYHCIICGADLGPFGD